MSESRPEHWDNRYRSVGAESVSWFQYRPSASLDLLDLVGVTAADSVIDVGGGAATLVDHLLERGHGDLTVLDTSAAALDVAQARTEQPDAVTWLVADLLRWVPDRTWDVWHDRAVLHFLTEDADREAYVSALRQAVRPGGAVVIGVFAEDGPTQCSGLPVRRHSRAELEGLLPDLAVIEQRREVHTTPSGASQSFNWIAGRLVNQP